MQRILEKEVMDDLANVNAYDKSDIIFHDFYNLIVQDIVKKFGKNLHNILDIRCGTAIIPVSLANLLLRVNITCLDASALMLKVAKRNAKLSKVNKKISFLQGKIPDIKLNKNEYNLIISDGVLHHIPNPDDFWKFIKINSKKNTAVYIVDLYRPESKEIAEQIVENAASEASQFLKKDFYNSLLAAFSMDEIKQQLLKNNLNLKVETIDERHVLMYGYI